MIKNYIYIHAYTNICIYIYIHIYLYLYIHLYIYRFVFVLILICIVFYINVDIDIDICVDVDIEYTTCSWNKKLHFALPEIKSVYNSKQLCKTTDTIIIIYYWHTKDIPHTYIIINIIIDLNIIWMI